MELGFLLIRICIAFIKWITFPFRIVFRGKKVGKPIPAIDNPLLLYSATKLAEKIRLKEVKSETVIQVYIDRIKQVHPILNAVVEDRFVDAIIEAQEIDKFLSQSSLTTDTLEELALSKPLFGVPVTIKESCSVKGLSLAVGFTFMKGTKADQDGAATWKLRNAGAIPLLVSTTSELCLTTDCFNLITGKTRNAYNTKRSSGGSSGGEGALIGSGSSLIGIGSDLAGSVRIPAMFNGIFGHKPTYDMVSIEGHWPTCKDERFSDYITIGPLARYAEDLKLMMNVLSDTDKVDFSLNVELKNINLFYMEDIGYYIGTQSVQKEVKEIMHMAVKYLSEAFHMEIKDEKFPGLKTILPSSMIHLLELNDKVNVLVDPKHPEVKYTALGQLFKAIFSKQNVNTIVVLGHIMNEQNCFIPKSHIPKHHELMSTLRQEMMDALGNNGIFLFPTSPKAAFRHNAFIWNFLNLAYTLPFNILGFPSTQVPLGFDNKGMPIGIQVIAAPYQDHLCLAVAEALEKQFGGWRPPFAA